MDPSLPEIFRDTAFCRAQRDFTPAIQSWRFLVWFGICEASIGGAGAYFSAGARALEQGLVTAAVIAGAAFVALGSAFVAIWATAPRRQRDDAREALERTLNHLVRTNESLHLVDRLELAAGTLGELPYRFWRDMNRRDIPATEEEWKQALISFTREMAASEQQVREIVAELREHERKDEA